MVSTGGAVAGLALAFVTSELLGRMISAGAGSLGGSMLYGVAPNDLATIVIASGVLVGVAVLAGLRPARRAGKLDPLQALRID